MRFMRPFSKIGKQNISDLIADVPARVAATLPKRKRRLGTATKLGLLSAGLSAVAIGIIVGRELRQRYKFNRRTPYDFYAHSGDEAQDVEFGLGI
jgi:hypothetical protein